MKKILISLFICSFMFSMTSCKKSSEKKLSLSSKSDTIFLQNQDILFISPSTQDIKNLKKKYGDNFYTIADDANNYFSEASNYLDSLKISYENYSGNKIIGFKTNNKFIEIPRFKNPWYLIFYKEGNYQTLDLINIRKEYPRFFNEKEYINSSNLNSKKIIDSIAENKYFLLDEKECDLNSDGLTDKIIVMANNNDIDSQNSETKIAPILILLNEQNNKYKILSNENIYPNNFGDSFSKLVIKNQFFTIELSNEVPNNYITEKYITFRFDEKTKKIVLFKYGQNIDWNTGKKDNILCSEKNFGKVLFQEYNSNRINEKCSQY